MEASLLTPKMVFDGVIQEFMQIQGTGYHELPECPLSEMGVSGIYLKHEKAIILTTSEKKILLSVGKVVLNENEDDLLDCGLIISEISLNDSRIREQILGFLQDNSVFLGSAFYGWKNGYISMNEDIIPTHEFIGVLVDKQNKKIKELMPCYSDSLEKNNLTFRLSYTPALYEKEFVRNFYSGLKAYIYGRWGNYNITENLSCMR